MGDVDRPQTPGEESARSQPFRFAGVELNPEDDAQAKAREQVVGRIKHDLWVSLIGSTLAGTAPLFIERWIARAGLIDLPSPYPYLSRGLLLFVGWAMYWGVRDVICADNLDERHPLEGFRDALELHGLLGHLGLALGALVLISYNLLGGGIYGFYRLVRRCRDDLTEVGA